MPRVKRGPDRARKTRAPELLDELVAELKNSHDGGQPMIEEFTFPRTNNVRVTVIWDKWDTLTDQARGELIIQAYQLVEAKDFTDRIALWSGYTMEEAYQSGLLTFQIVPLIRDSDVVSLEECRQAMIDEGASVLWNPERPPLWLMTLEDAEACRKRLSKRLPGSEPIWTIMSEVPGSGSLIHDAERRLGLE
jgi:hypothetical protein